MERKFSLLYNDRHPVMLSQYEVSSIIMALSEEIKLWERLYKSSTTDEDRYSMLEIKLHRVGLRDRLETIREELFPLPF